jgi:hypothetical protein
MFLQFEVIAAWGLVFTKALLLFLYSSPVVWLTIADRVVQGKRGATINVDVQMRGRRVFY